MLHHTDRGPCSCECSKYKRLDFPRNAVRARSEHSLLRANFDRRGSSVRTALHTVSICLFVGPRFIGHGHRPMHRRDSSRSRLTQSPWCSTRGYTPKAPNSPPFITGLRHCTMESAFLLLPDELMLCVLALLPPHDVCYVRASDRCEKKDIFRLTLTPTRTPWFTLVCCILSFLVFCFMSCSQAAAQPRLRRGAVGPLPLGPMVAASADGATIRGLVCRLRAPAHAGCGEYLVPKSRSPLPAHARAVECQCSGGRGASITSNGSATWLVSCVPFITGPSC